MTPDAAVLPSKNQLALERTRLAHERTLMAWTRTATSLISFGFSIYKFFQYLREAQPAVKTGLIGPRRFALIMIGTGILALVLATIEHHRCMKRLPVPDRGMPYSLATLVAALVALLGVLGIITVLLNR